MPEIKIKHVVSFSSEDKIHKAENILKSETYRKWKCATPGEKSASIVLQFEKATKIYSIDIGNECSAFVEVLVGRSSDTVKDYQVLLVASSFMTPLESRNETHTNRVRMFGHDKLAQNLRDEKWDCVQVVCTQPFNKNIAYGLSFIKFLSPPERNEEKPPESKATNATTKLGAFKIKYEDEDEDSSPSIGSWMDRKNNSSSLSTNIEDSSSYAAAILSSNNTTQQNNSLKRKLESTKESDKPPAKKELSNRNDKASVFGFKKDTASTTTKEKIIKDALGVKKTEVQKVLNQSANDKPSTSTQQRITDNKRPFNKIMERIVLVISGFVNPLRGEIRDKALEMGAKYKGDWDKSCTHLVCAFVNTPKYIQVRSQGGRIVTKDWIIDCYKKKHLLDWKLYMLGSYTMDSSGESSEEYTPPKKQIIKKANLKVKDKPSHDAKTKVKPKPKLPQSSSDSDSDDHSLLATKNTEKIENISPKKRSSPQSLTLSNPQNCGSETEDEDALEDYMAATDIGSDSGGNTEDEIRKVEEEMARKAEKEDSDDNSSSLLPSEVNTSNLPLPELPNLFKKRHFFLYGDFSPPKYHDLQRYITAYNGMIEDYMSDTVKYVITESKWDQNFEEALNNNEDLIFVKPEWIFKCQEVGKLVPYQSYIITPDS